MSDEPIEDTQELDHLHEEINRRDEQITGLRADLERLREVLRLESDRANNGWAVVEAVQAAVLALATPERMNLPGETNLIEAIEKAGEYIDHAVNECYPERPVRE